MVNLQSNWVCNGVDVSLLVPRGGWWVGWNFQALDIMHFLELFLEIVLLNWIHLLDLKNCGWNTVHLKSTLPGGQIVVDAIYEKVFCS